MNQESTEFSAFNRLATQLLAKHSRKLDEHYIDYDNQLGEILALYMMNRVSRYAVAKYMSGHWSWEKSIDSLILTEVLQEADKYKPEYKGEYHETPRS